jgi:hypothetical protein
MQPLVRAIVVERRRVAQEDLDRTLVGVVGVVGAQRGSVAQDTG